MKIVCKFEEVSGGISFTLSLCDDNEREQERLWGEKINTDVLDDAEKDLLMLAHGMEFCEQEAWFNQLKELSRRLHNVVYNPSQPFSAEEAKQLHSDMFRILGEKMILA